VTAGIVASISDRRRRSETAATTECHYGALNRLAGAEGAQLCDSRPAMMTTFSEGEKDVFCTRLRAQMISTLAEGRGCPDASGRVRGHFRSFEHQLPATRGNPTMNGWRIH